METLIRELQKQLPIEILLNSPAHQTSENEVFSNGKIYRADRILSALPPPIPKKSIWVVNLCFAGDVLPKKGFGFLVPTKEKETLLGTLFDSTIFPQQNVAGETRLTAMLREEEANPLEAALDALRRHLKILAKPIFSSVFLAKNAIPQFEVGYGYTEGISVDACVERGEKLALSLK